MLHLTLELTSPQAGAEESEAYELQIVDGGTVKRTLVASGPSVTYSGAHQAADWGALLGPGNSLDVRIYQLSTLVGRGAPAVSTLRF